MKIAILIDSIVGIGGAQKEALYLARTLIQKKHNATIYTYYWDKKSLDHPVFKELPIKAVYENEIAWRKAFSNNFKSSALKRIYGTALLPWLRSKKLAEIVPSDVDVVNPHDRAHLVTLRLKRKCKKAMFVAMLNDLPLSRWNAVRFEKEISLLEKILRTFIDAIEYLFLRAHDRIVVLDNLNKDVLKQMTNLDASVVRSGLDSDYYLSRIPEAKPTKSPDDTFSILCVGILMRHRRFEDVIKAVDILLHQYKIKVSIVGGYQPGDEYKAELDQLITDLDVGKYIQFLGAVSDEQLLQLFNENDVFVFPNHNQTWGLAVFEAQASGMPVIVSRTTGASEVLTDGENALLVPPKMPEKIAEALIRLIGDSETRSQIAQKGQKFAVENISWENYTDGMLRVFTQKTR